jgi:hypothetical protein
MPARAFTSPTCSHARRLIVRAKATDTAADTSRRQGLILAALTVAASTAPQAAEAGMCDSPCSVANLFLLCKCGGKACIARIVVPYDLRRALVNPEMPSIEQSAGPTCRLTKARPKKVPLSQYGTLGALIDLMTFRCHLDARWNGAMDFYRAMASA